jgi:hypothetical protein
MTNDDAMEHMKKLGLEIAHTIGDRIGPPMTIRAVKTTSSCLIAGNYHEAYISAQVDPTTLRVTSARSGVDVIETKFDPWPYWPLQKDFHPKSPYIIRLVELKVTGWIEGDRVELKVTGTLISKYV